MVRYRLIECAAITEREGINTEISTVLKTAKLTDVYSTSNISSAVQCELEKYHHYPGPSLF